MMNAIISFLISVAGVTSVLLNIQWLFNIYEFIAVFLLIYSIPVYIVFIAFYSIIMDIINNHANMKKKYYMLNKYRLWYYITYSLFGLFMIIHGHFIIAMLYISSVFALVCLCELDKKYEND